MQAAKENRFLGLNSWRLPKLSEFRRVIGDDGKCNSRLRAASSRLSYPISNNGGLGDFWASTTINYITQTDERSLTKNDNYAASVNFENGGFGGDFINYQHPVRLIRNGESPPVQGSSDEKKMPSQPIQQNSRLASKLKGAWIIDPKATENFLLSATPPSNARKLAEWFGLAGGYWALFTYEFDGDLATMSAYRGARKFEFKLLSQQGTEIKYTLKDDTSSPVKTLSVFLFKNGNIKIVPSESPESSYVLWKRGALKTEQATPDDVMAASRTWLASLQNIVKFLRETPEKTLEHPIPIAKEDPHPALEAAIRNGAIRKATPADAQAWLDADVEKYRRKNLSPLNNSHESSILSTEISKGSAYVVLKKYTYPPGLKNNNRAIFLIPRNVPVPDGNYGDSKIYHFYTEYFAGTSVEYNAGSSW